MRTLTATTIAALLMALTSSALADDGVAIAPLISLGEGSSKEVKSMQRALENGVGKVKGFATVPSARLMGAIKKANRPELRSCDGVATCLSQLGKLVGAKYTIYGEVGGLGDAKVVYLKLIDTSNSKLLRSTTLELKQGEKVDGPAHGAAVRLLAPKRFTGTLAVSVGKVKGAVIYIDGRKRGKSPAKSVRLTAGTHALRVTHPQFRDYVRFVEISFGKKTTVDVALEKYAAVESDVRRTERDKLIITDAGVEKTPWYRRWYAIAGAGAVVLVTGAVIAGVLTGGIDFDSEATVE